MNDMNREEWIARLAEGDQSPEARQWLAENPSALAKVNEAKRLLSAARIPMWDAPEPLQQHARGVFQERAPVRATQWTAAFGVRAAQADALMANVESEEISVRIRATQEGQGWDVRGRIEPVGAWEVNLGATEITADAEGRFAATVSELPSEIELALEDRFERIELERY